MRLVALLLLWAACGGDDGALPDASPPPPDASPPADAAPDAGIAACANGVDDDCDALVDLEDPGCTDAADPDERNYLPVGCIESMGFAIDPVTLNGIGTISASDPNNYAPSCGAGDGDEAIFLYEVPVTPSCAVSIRATTNNPGTTVTDTTISVHRQSCVGQPEACGAVTVTVDDLGPGFIWFIVDSPTAGTSGDVEISLEIL
jgi:hypothetical protein